MNLLGEWYNELKSRMIITSASDGQLTGTYQSIVGDVDPTKTYVLSGRYDSSCEGKTLGWAVTWLNAYHHSDPPSTTTWSGQYQVNEQEKPEILTTWLLTAQTTPDFNWNSTNVGFDTFTRDIPTEEVYQKALKRGLCSHPKVVVTSSK